MKHLGLGLCSVLIAALVAPAGSSASYHEMQIREVSAGTGTGDGYVMLQMYRAGQHFVAGHKVDIYNATGAVVATATFPAMVANGSNQSTILVGESGVANRDLQLNFSLASVVNGGAACFDAIPVDCLSWGSGFTGNAMLPTPGAGTPAGALLTTGAHALRRDISAGCATLLQASDDTNDSAADFDVVTPNPRPNSQTPIETPCTNPDPGPDPTPDPDPTPNPDPTPSPEPDPGDSKACADAREKLAIVLANLRKVKRKLKAARAAFEEKASIRNEEAVEDAKARLKRAKAKVARGSESVEQLC